MIWARRDTSLSARLTRQLRGRVGLTYLGLVIEAVLRAFWPLLALMGFVGAALLFGVADHVADRVLVPLIWGSALIALIVFGVGLWRLRLPKSGAAIAALDAALPGHPIRTVHDNAANADGADGPIAALWAHHQKIMFERALTAKARAPKPRLARYDRFALRLVALTLLVAGLIFGTPPSFWPGLSPQGRAMAAAGPDWEGWITPPPHAAMPARYLPDLASGKIEVLQGSEISLRFFDGGAARLTQDLGTLSGPSDRPTLIVEQAGRLAITGRTGREWQVSLRPDDRPQIDFQPAPQQGEEGQLQLGFAASDDFGILEAWAEIRLDLPQVDRSYHRQRPPEWDDTLTLPLPLPIAGQRATITDRLEVDLSQHRLAQLPVTITLFARDANDQIGQSDTVAMILPGRRFFAPMAAAVIEQRQALLWHRDNGRDAALLLRALGADDAALRSATSRLGLALVTERLHRAALREPMSDAMQSHLSAELWRLAEQIEEGDLGSALERLRRARERLDQAMRDGASPEEIEQLMQEYRDALQAWTEELAQRSQGEDAPPPQQDGQSMSGQDLQEMMDEIQRLMEEGRVDEAMALLDLLQEMLENMQVTPGGQGGQTGQALNDTLREQQELSDDAFRDLQEQQDGPPSGQGSGGSANGPSTAPPDPNAPGSRSGEGLGQNEDGAAQPSRRGGAPQTSDELAERQGDLRDGLEDLRNDLPPPGTEEGDRARDALDGAGQAMDRAEDALRDGDLGRTLSEQAQAIGEMRRALRAMDDAERNRGDRATRAEDQRDIRESTDPLGRERNSGQAATDGQLGPTTDPSDRAREVEQFLAERLGRRDLDPDERAYLEQLLERF